jgi:hypothetical protein
MDIYDGAPWTEEDVEDLKAAIGHRRSVEEAAEFLCRSGSVADVEQKCREPGLAPHPPWKRPGSGYRARTKKGPA